MLHETIQAAKENVPLTRKSVDAIFYSWESVLYNDREPWLKKMVGSFDATMGTYDGVEKCGLIGILCYV